MLSRILIIMSTLAAVVLFLVLNTTTPKTAGALGVLGVFVLGYIVLLGLSAFCIYGASRVATRVVNILTVRRPVAALSLRKSYYYATVVALGPVIIISLQSVGAVGGYELGLVLLLVVIGCLYIAKRTS